MHTVRLLHRPLLPCSVLNRRAFLSCAPPDRLPVLPQGYGALGVTGGAPSLLTSSATPHRSSLEASGMAPNGPARARRSCLLLPLRALPLLLALLRGGSGFLLPTIGKGLSGAGTSTRGRGVGLAAAPLGRPPTTPQAPSDVLGRNVSFLSVGPTEGEGKVVVGGGRRFPVGAKPQREVSRRDALLGVAGSTFGIWAIARSTKDMAMREKQDPTNGVMVRGACL
jgi:hypothetical protein